jgi:hypothetical protein
VITGHYFDASTVLHGFLRARNGSITALDAPGAGTGAFQGTKAEAINPAGVITGTYFDANGTSHGFLWIPHGTRGDNYRRVRCLTLRLLGSATERDRSVKGRTLRYGSVT